MAETTTSPIRTIFSGSASSRALLGAQAALSSAAGNIPRPHPPSFSVFTPPPRPLIAAYQTVERLYNTNIGHTRADRQAVYDSYNPLPLPLLSTLAASNSAAKSIIRPEGGPLIVSYPTPRRSDNQKQETLLTPRGKCRNAFGGA
jgi:hypothetical protein